MTGSEVPQNPKLRGFRVRVSSLGLGLRFPKPCLFVLRTGCVVFTWALNREPEAHPGERPEVFYGSAAVATANS